MSEARSTNVGVLLLNMGGPADLSDVEDYIFRLMSDPDMIRLPLGRLLQKPFARFVAKRRAPKVRERYGLIGGASPIGPATDRQAELLAAELRMPVGYAMRYTPPSVSDAVASLQQRDVTRLVVIPLYPQYSTVSTRSSLRDYELNVSGHIESRVIDRHFGEPGYIKAMQDLLQAKLVEIDPGLKTRILFVAHSIPESYIEKGDPYAAEIEATAKDVISGIPGAPQHSLAYQSRVGPVKWRGPSLEEALDTLTEQGVQQVVVQPLSFVSENLETLYDLDIVFRQQCAEAGITHFLRVPALNDSPQYIAALAGMSRRVMSDWGAAHA